MLVNATTLKEIFRNLKTTFNLAFAAVTNQWQVIAMEVPSTGSGNDYAWLSNFPKMKRWIGTKNVKSLEAYKYSIENEDFESTIAVKRNHIDDDQLGIYKPQAEMAGYSAAQFPDELVGEAINGVFINKCYDGQYFIDTDHSVMVDGVATSVSNKGTKALSIATQALAMASFGAARTAMRKFKDDEGRPLGVRPNVLLVPPALEDLANVLKNNDKFDDGKPNPYKGTFEVVVADRWETDTAWMLLDTTKPVKPFIYQSRKAPVFVSMTDPNNPHVFSLGEYLYGVEARGASGYGFWQLAWGSDGTT